MAQWLVEGLTATISGVVTVFVVLILIALIIGSLQYLINPKKTMALLKQRKVDKANALAKSEATDEAEVNEPESSVVDQSVQSNLQDDMELVAVITAAIAASMDVSSDRLVVRSIRRVGSRNGWQKRS